MTNALIQRPPIGLIVEGHGEEASFRSLISNILGINNLYIPISNTGGYGKIVTDLSNEIRKLLLVSDPFNVIVCVDLIDVISEGIVTNCSELLLLLSNQIQSFQDNLAQSDPRLLPLPNRITIVIQIPKLESWMISDIQSLIDIDIFNDDLNQIQNLDQSEIDPTNWIMNNQKDKCFNPKKPKDAKIIISSLNPDQMRQNSKSFDKFFREITYSYEDWCSSCGIEKS